MCTGYDVIGRPLVQCRKSDLIGGNKILMLMD